MLVFESSEISDVNNVARKRMQNDGFSLISYEGYTVNYSKVTMFLDRAKLVHENKLHSGEIFKEIKRLIGEEFSIKRKFAEKLGVPWKLVVYRDDETCIVLDMINNGEVVARFNTFKELGEWTKNFRGYVMTSKYESDGLPEIDRKLREVGIPWPGNMDKAICYNNEVVAIIEFQKTDSTKSPVRQHDNNKYFKPMFNHKGEKVRKGDEFRWKVLDHLRKHSNLPLIIIVWSESEDEVGIKLVDNIVYSKQDPKKAGIYYKNPVIYTNLENLTSYLNNILGI